MLERSLCRLFSTMCNKDSDLCVDSVRIASDDIPVTISIAKPWRACAVTFSSGEAVATAAASVSSLVSALLCFFFLLPDNFLSCFSISF